MEKCHLPELNRIIMCSSHNDLQDSTPPKMALILKLQSNNALYYLSICDAAEALTIQTSFGSDKNVPSYFLLYVLKLKP